jgi:hypothetical protein
MHHSGHPNRVSLEFHMAILGCQHFNSIVTGEYMVDEFVDSGGEFVLNTVTASC